MTAACLGDKLVGFRCTLEREDVHGGVSTVVANQLLVKMRLLHHITACILISETDRFDFITERKLMIMIALAWRMAVNLQGIMAHQMQEAVTSRRLSLPMG